MKIYVLRFDLSLVHSRLRKFRLREFNSETPELFIEKMAKREFKNITVLVASNAYTKKNDISEEEKSKIE